MLRLSIFFMCGILIFTSGAFARETTPRPHQIFRDYLKEYGPEGMAPNLDINPEEALNLELQGALELIDGDDEDEDDDREEQEEDDNDCDSDGESNGNDERDDNHSDGLTEYDDENTLMSLSDSDGENDYDCEIDEFDDHAPITATDGTSPRLLVPSVPGLLRSYGHHNFPHSPLKRAPLGVIIQTPQRPDLENPAPTMSTVDLELLEEQCFEEI